MRIFILSILSIFLLAACTVEVDHTFEKDQQLYEQYMEEISSLTESYSSVKEGFDVFYSSYLAGELTEEETETFKEKTKQTLTLLEQTTKKLDLLNAPQGTVKFTYLIVNYHADLVNYYDLNYYLLLLIDDSFASSNDIKQKIIQSYEQKIKDKQKELTKDQQKLTDYLQK